MPEILKINEKRLVNLLSWSKYRGLKENIYINPQTGEMNWHNPLYADKKLVKLISYDDDKWLDIDNPVESFLLEKIFSWVNAGWTVSGSSGELYIIRINTY